MKKFANRLRFDRVVTTFPSQVFFRHGVSSIREGAWIVFIDCGTPFEPIPVD